MQNYALTKATRHVVGQPTQLQSYMHVNGEKLLPKTGRMEEEGAALCLLGNVSACRGRQLKKNAETSYEGGGRPRET